MLFTYPRHENAKKIAKQQDGNAVHSDICRGSLALVFAVHSRSSHKVEKKTTKTKTRMGKFMSHKKEIMQCTCRSNAVRFLVGRQCGFLSDAVRATILGRKKTECPHFGKFEIPLEP